MIIMTTFILEQNMFFYVRCSARSKEQSGDSLWENYIILYICKNDLILTPNNPIKMLIQHTQNSTLW